MSTLDIIRHYSSLLIIQYFGKPRAKATVELQASSDLMPQVSVQEITPSAIPIAGAMVLSYNGVSSVPINWDDDNATTAAKIQAITGLATVLVEGSLQDGLITVTFVGIEPPAELLVVESDTLVYGIDGGHADTLDSDFYTTIDSGDASTTYPDIIDGGDASGTGPGIDADVSVVETDEILPLAVMNGYNLIGDNIAQGVQLDVLGKYIGVQRSGVGFTGQITLDDDEFLTLIQIGIIRNRSKALFYDIQLFLQQFFGNTILVFDYQNMRISYMIDEEFGSQDLIQLFVTQGLLPKPMGVQLAAIVYAPIITTFYGFRTYFVNTTRNSPLNSYFDYQMDRPWLSYADGVTI